jgi:NADPH:quinone reductase-like Zn-dependent oxidoreductase
MRAVVHDRDGPPEVLRVAEVERPVPKEDEVLVRVRASTVTRGDAMGVRSVDYRFTRLFTGILRPRRTSFGSEFAGRVEEAGSAVTDLRVGEEMFGVEGGANAEYVAVRESGVIAQKPTGLTYEEAAAVPDGSLLALTCLRPGYPLRGKSVLVYGAAGSVGTAAVQLLAHHFEAEVTAVCDTKDVELVRSLGAREVLDRFRQDFTKNGKTYDVVFDAVGKQSFRRCRRSLKPGGIYISMDPGSCTTCRCSLSSHGSSGAGERRSASAAIAGRTFS